MKTIKEETPRIISRNITNKLNHAQKTVNVIHPVRGFRRFGPVKLANSGIDPVRCFYDFLNKDVIKPLKKPKLVSMKPLEIDQFNTGKWSVGTCKRCNNSNSLPKLENFKEYNFPKPSVENIEHYRSTFLSTDHIGIRIPDLRQNYGPDSFLNRKAKYGAQSETKEGWAPRIYIKCSPVNRSNVDYNIINFQKNSNYISGNFDMLDKTYNHKKKGVGEFADFKSPFNTNFNKEYLRLVESDTNIFKNYKGVFSNLYDSASKNGCIYMPFKDSKINKDGKNNNIRYHGNQRHSFC